MSLLPAGKKGRKGRDQKTIHRIKKYQKDVRKVLVVTTSCPMWSLTLTLTDLSTWRYSRPMWKLPFCERIQWTTGKLDWERHARSIMELFYLDQRKWDLLTHLVVVLSEKCKLYYIQYLVVKLGYYWFVTKLQRDVVYLGWPKSPSYIYEPQCGGRGELRDFSQWVQLYTRDQINFGDLTLCECILIYIAPSSDMVLRPVSYTVYTVKKVSFFLSPAGMSLTKLSLSGNNLQITGLGEFG